jgi:ABC-type glycerol-3-phosphate transport system substrate-binding protein
MSSIGQSRRTKARGYAPVPNAAGIALLAALTVAACTSRPSSATRIASPSPSTAAVPTAAAPQATNTPPAASSLKGNVVIWLAWSPQEMAALSDLVAAFQAHNPGVRFSLTYIRPGDLRSRLEAAVNGGGAPTVFFGPSQWGPALLAAGAIQDVGARVLPELQDSMRPLAWSQVAYGQTVLGLPLEMQGEILYRNVVLQPEPAATVFDLVKWAKVGTDRFADSVPLDLGFAHTGGFLATCGGTFGLPSGDPGADERAGVCWLTLLTRLRGFGPLVFNMDKDVASFSMGHSPWLIESTQLQPELAKAVGAKGLAIDPWPIYEPTGQRLRGFVWTENAYFVRSLPAEDLEASWAFVISLLSPEAQSRFADALGSRHLPVLRSVTPPDATLARIQEVLDQGVAEPLVPDLSLYAVPLERAILAVTGQGTDPAVAYQRALDTIQSSLNKSAAGG